MIFRNGIIIGMIAFIIFIVSMVLVLNSKGSDLTTDDYYLKENTFESELNARRLAIEFNNPLSIKISDNNIIFLCDNKTKVTDLMVEFTRMNNKNLDKSFSIDKLPYAIPMKNFVKGNYSIKSIYKIKNQSLEQDTSIVLK